MTDLMRRIRRAVFKSADASETELRDALNELGISGGNDETKVLRRIQRAILTDGHDEDENLRAALDDLQIGGGINEPRPMDRVRRAILRPPRNAEGLLRKALDDLGVVPEQAPSGGGGEPEYEGPLDLIAGASAAFSSARALSSAMRGEALYTIRRHSDDSEQSYSSDASTGEAPSATITTFVGAALTKTGAMFESSDEVALNNSTGVRVGQPVTGTGLPADTVALEVMGPTTALVKTGETNGSEEVTLVDATDVAVGQVVTGANIPEDTIVLDVDDAPRIVISRSATGSNPSQSLTFHPTIRVDQVPTATNAAVTLTLTPLAGVATWNDQSGNDRDLVQETAARQPSWRASELNGKPGLVWPFPSLSEGDFTHLATASVSFGVPCTLFMVFRRRDNVGPETSGIFGMYDAGNYVRAQFLTAPASGFDDQNFGLLLDAYTDPNEAGGTSDPMAFAESDFYVLDAAWTFGTWSAKLDGASLTKDLDADSGEAPAAISTNIVVGGYRADSVDYNDFWWGTICELIIYPSILSDPQRLAIRQNIAAFYDITL